MQRALVAGILIAVMAGLLGAFVVQRRLAFLGDGLAHASFGGMGLGGVAVAFAANAGLTPDMAVAVSVAYGLIVLVSSLPGLFVLLSVRTSDESDADETDTFATSGR